MGILSTLLFGKKEKDEDRMRRAAQGQSVVGSILGSPYTSEWNRQKRDLNEQFDKRERLLRKKWRKEDEDIHRGLQKDQARYQRKMNPDKAARFYASHEREEWRDIQRKRDRELLELNQEKNDAIRNISKTIKGWKE